MNSIRADVPLTQGRLGVGYAIAGRRCGDVAVYLLQVRLEDPVYPRRISYARGADNGVVGRAQGQEFGDYRIPVLFERLDCRTQARLAVHPAAGSVPVRFARVPEVVDADVERYDLSSSEGPAHRRIIAKSM